MAESLVGDRSLLANVFAAILMAGVTVLPINQSDFVKVFRAVFLHLKFYAVIYILFAVPNDPITPWLFDLFFPLVRLNLFVSEGVVYPLIGGLFSDSVGHLVSWNAFLVTVFLILNFCLGSLSFTGVIVFSALQATDIQLTISAIFCSWKSGLGYWPSTLCFSMTLQWFLVSVILPATFLTNRKHETDKYLPNDFKQESDYNWLWPLGQVSILIAWLHICAIWLSANLAVQLMVSAAAVWFLVYLHETMWPFELRLVNQIVGDQFKALWLLLFWFCYKNPYVFGAVVLFSLRKVIFHCAK